MNHGIPSVNMMRRTSSSSIASSTLANATIMEEESANMRVNSAMSQRYSTSIDRSTSLRREQSSRTNSIHINSSARSSLDQQRSHPFDDSIDDTVDTILNENEDTAAQYTITGPTPSVSSLLDSQRRIRRLSLHQASSSASSLSRFRKSDMDPMSLSLPSLSRPSTTNSISPSTTQRANLPSQWTRSNQLNASPVSNLSKLASSHTADTNDAVDDILRSIDAEDNDNHAIVCDSNSGDQDQRKRAVRGTLRTLNGKVADDSSTDADSPRLSIRTSIEGLRAPRGIVSRPILASTNDRNAHARSMSDFPDSVLAGDYAAVQELMETRATASTTDGYGNITSTNNGYGNLSALARGRTSVSNTATPTTPHRFHRIERATSLTSSNFIERFNNMNLTTPDDVSIANTTRLQRSSSRRSRTGNDDASDHSSSGRTPSLVSSRLNGLNSGNTEVNAVDGICTRAQKLLVRAQQEFCTARRTSTTLSNNSGNNSAGLQTPTRSLLSVLDGQRQPLDTNLPAGVSLSPHLGPVTSSSLNDTNQYLNPGSNDAQFAGPSVESRLDEVVESSIRLDRILRQVSTDLRKGHTAEASQAAIDLWRDSEQIVRGLTDVLLGLSAGVPRARSPAILPLNDRAVTSQTNNGGSSTPVNESPRGTPTRLFRVTGGISGKLSANGRAIPTPLQLPTPVSDHEQVNDVPLSAVSQFVSDTAGMEMNKLSNSNGIVSHGSIRRQRALSQLISPSTRTGSFFTVSSTTPTTATTLPASAVTTPTTPNGTRHTRARTITSSFANGAYSGLASSRTFPSASQQYSNVTTHGLFKTDTTATATSLRSNHHNMAKSTAPIDDIRSPSLSARRF
ncbi:hypothetical protein BDF19DRAFT_410072 [Syncephalis fuscata]|nr:hypothetical protein BDF19DRAFT_410072 [Syncephalis fuscata]